MNKLLDNNPNIREPGGELLMRASGTSAHYYHYDELGSTRLLTNSTGSVTDTYNYDAYGSLITHNRSTGSVDQPYQYVGRLGYYTHHQSPDFRWLQLGVRFYQPDEGRFERRDPVVRLQRSSVVYTRNRPLVLVDPSGLFEIPSPIKWLCRMFPKLPGCKEAVKPIGNVNKCIKAYDCTKCAADMLEQGIECSKLQDTGELTEEMMVPPCWGNGPCLQMICLNRLSKKYGRRTVKDCLTLCAKIPIEMLAWR